MLKLEQMELVSDEAREIYEFTYEKEGIKLHTYFEKVNIEEPVQPKDKGLLLIEA